MDSLKLLCAGLLLLCAVGCEWSKTYGTVTGDVTYNGKPLPYGSVMLQSDAGGPPATGVIERDGTFTLKTPGLEDRIPTGTYRIRVTCFEGQAPEAQARGGGESPLGRSAIPMKYTRYATSGLVMEVASGENVLALELAD